MVHQYIERSTRRIHTERPYGNEAVRILCSRVRESSPWLFRMLISKRASRFLSYMNYSGILADRLQNHLNMQALLNIHAGGCFEPAEKLDTLRKIFERKNRNRQYRPAPNDPAAFVAPADSRMLMGSFAEAPSLFIKGKFFDYDEMLGALARGRWR